MSVGKIWKDTGWFHAPKTATDVMQAIARLGTHSTNHRFAWRGHADADWPWQSSLQRSVDTDGLPPTESVVRAAEKAILAEARSRGLGVVGGQHVDDLQLLSDLQHYGVPTRLVDVTSNPTTALWFATAEKFHPGRSGAKPRGKGGLLIAVNMHWYGTDTVFSTAPVDAKSPHEQLEAALKLDTPFAVGSSMPNDRLRAQEGYFIASAIPESPHGPLLGMQSDRFGNGTETIERVLHSKSRGQGYPHNMPFVALYIRPSLKSKLRKYLKFTYSRTSKTLFPDYFGMKDFGEWRELMKREYAP